MAQQAWGGRTALSPRLLTGAGWLLGLVCAGATLASEDLLFRYHSPHLHLVLNAVDACVALLLTYLLVGRFRRTRRLQDLLLAVTLLLLAAAGLVVGLLLEPERPDASGHPAAVWGSLCLRLTAAILVVVAALSGSRLVRPGRAGVLAAAPVLAALAGILLVWFVRADLPVPARPDLTAGGSPQVVVGHPGLVAAQSLAAACFLVASIGFTLRAQRSTDELLRCLGPACALAGFARLSYAVFPSWYSGWVYTGDLLRLGCYLVLLVGATREIAKYWSAYTRVALVEDRRRFARELHDGVLQELRLVKLLAQDPETPGEETRTAIIEACDRAIEEARAAVEAWGRAPEEPLAYVLHRAALDVADRYGGHVAVELDDAVEVAPTQRHDLARITREAVGNAIRHGTAECVRIVLERTPTGGRLVVRDDGSGFDPEAATSLGGYGLTSMRDRAHRLPGSLEVRSGPGAGTSVVVTW